MVQLLNVAIDDNGEIVFETADLTTMKSFYNLENEDEAEIFFKKAIVGSVEQIWEKQNVVFSRVVRAVGMAEMCACAQPYEQAEEFWSSMMFDFIPAFERFAHSLKEKYGLKWEEVTRPLTYRNPEFFGSPMKMVN